MHISRSQEIWINEVPVHICYWFIPQLSNNILCNYHWYAPHYDSCYYAVQNVPYGKVGMELDKVGGWPQRFPS